MDTFLFVLEVIGVAASAVSGTLTAIKKEMDVFGVVTLGLTAAVGGGIVRDLVLGITPPKTFQDPKYALMAIAVSLAVFLMVYAHKLHYETKLFDKVLLFMDTIGLATYTMVGVGVAFSQTQTYSPFLLVFVGVVTGVGGGVMRDLFAGDRPYIFVKHVYACASLIGAVVTIVLRGIVGETLSTVAGMAVIIVMRGLSAHYKWNLPKIKYSAEKM